MADKPDDTPCALVVDDNALIRMDASSILEDAGYVTLEAGDAHAALDLLRDRYAQVQLLFTDVQMPGTMNGFDLAQETARCWPHIVIVVASGEATPAPGDMPEGATFIGKPFSAKLIHQRLQATVPDHQLPGQLRG